MLEQYPLLVELNLFFPTFLDKYHESPQSGCVYPGFECLELGKNVEMIGFPGKPRLEIYTTFLGIHGTSKRRSSRFKLKVSWTFLSD